MSWNKFESRLGVLSYHATKPAQKTVVYIHGGFGGVDSTENLSNELECEYQILSPCLPGHGKSFALNRKSTYNDLKDPVSDFLNHVHDKFGKFVLTGHSLGGRVAWDLSETHTDHIDKLLLFSPLLTPINSSFIQTAIRVSTDYVSSVKSPIENIWKYGLIDNFLRPLDLVHIWRIISSLGPTEFTSQTLPAMVVWGKKDKVLPLDNTKVFLAQIKAVSLLSINEGHYGYNTGDHWDEIREFLK